MCLHAMFMWSIKTPSPRNRKPLALPFTFLEPVFLPLPPHHPGKPWDLITEYESLPLSIKAPSVSGVHIQQCNRRVHHPPWQSESSQTHSGLLPITFRWLEKSAERKKQDSGFTERSSFRFHQCSNKYKWGNSRPGNYKLYLMTGPLAMKVQGQ